MLAGPGVVLGVQQRHGWQRGQRGLVLEEAGVRLGGDERVGVRRVERLLLRLRLRLLLAAVGQLLLRGLLLQLLQLLWRRAAHRVIDDGVAGDGG